MRQQEAMFLAQGVRKSVGAEATLIVNKFSNDYGAFLGVDGFDRQFAKRLVRFLRKELELG